jgi:uracil-DNA glycosylase
MSNTARLRTHLRALSACAACPDMKGPVVTGRPVGSPVMLIGQAPGVHEGELGRPFAWTAGRTMFGWFAGIGLDEEAFRSRVYMAAVCRCFPGKNPKGGDRVPAREEIEACSRWLRAEYQIVQPELVLPVGKLAIAQVLPGAADKLDQVVGRPLSTEIAPGRTADVIALPHPSGASTWHRMEPGVTLLRTALALIAAHPAWRRIAAPPAAGSGRTAAAGARRR